MNILKSVFTVTNNDIHKVITVAGIKIKLKSKILILKNKIKELEKENKKVIKEKNSVIKTTNEKYKKIINDKNKIIQDIYAKHEQKTAEYENEKQLVRKEEDEYFNKRLTYLNEKNNNISNIYFSVIMPTYNRIYCIKNAIDSLLNQTYQNFELIICDDCSTDNTEEFIKQSYKKELEERKIIYIKLEKNGGASFARNVALKHAQYDWIAYLDSDNTVRPYFLSEFAFAIENNNNLTYYAGFKKLSGVVSNNIFDYNKLLNSNYIDLGIFVHHKSLIEKYGDFNLELSACNDWDIVLKYTKDNPPFHIPVVTLDYSDENDNSRLSLDKNKKDSDIEIIHKIHNENI